LHTTTPLAQQLTWAAAYLTDQGVTGELKMRRGVVADEIALEALEGDYNLVVVGARAGSNFWNDLLVGSITPHIVEKAPCSVLVVRTKTAPPPTD
ncbi:MAG: universal stress protein, partial [Candidatus Promineifilaceae bacterium]